MIYSNYRNEFTEKALNNGFSKEQVDKCLLYALPIAEQGLPVIYNTSNLSALVGYNVSYLKRAALFSKFFYTEYSIKKKNGNGKRIIQEPLPSLKEIQTWILQNVLNYIPISRFAKAYIKGNDLIENVKFHRDKDYLLCLDLKNFFPSIPITSVERVFNNLGYSSNVANLLAKLCCREERLTQGSPTSPALSNIIMKGFDDEISKYCLENNIRYSRYADDLTFSYSINPKSMEILSINDFKRQLIYKVTTTLIAYTPFLKINESKIKLSGKSDRQIVTGIIVNNKSINTPLEYRKKIRQEIFYINKYGIDGHLEKSNNSKDNYLHHLLGKINYALHINKTDKKMLEYREYVKSLLN